jgi:hypothetical protein
MIALKMSVSMYDPDLTFHVTVREKLDRSCSHTILYGNLTEITSHYEFGTPEDAVIGAVTKAMEWHRQYRESL